MNEYSLAKVQLNYTSYHYIDVQCAQIKPIQAVMV